MENTRANGNKNGTTQRWRRPKEKKKYTAAERRLIETTRAVMEVIEKQKAAGAFDEYLECLNEERAKT